MQAVLDVGFCASGLRRKKKTGLSSAPLDWDQVRYLGQDSPGDQAPHVLFVSSVGPPSSDGTAGPVALGSLEVDGKLGHCPKPLEPFDGELCFVEASPSGSFVFGLTADGLCVLWNTNIAQKPADSSTIAHASSNKSAPSGVPLLDTGQPAINCTRTFWLPVVTFPLDTPPRFGPDMGHPIVEDPSTSALSPVAAASVGSPLNSIRRAFSRGLFSHKRRGLGFYQPNSPPILSRVHWARVSDDGARVVVSASPKAGADAGANLWHSRTIFVWRSSAGWDGVGEWSSFTPQDAPGSGPRFPGTDGGPRPSAAASVGPQSLLDAAFVDDSTACGSLLLVDVRVSAAGAGASGSSGVSLVPQHRPCGLSPVLDVVLWSASAAAGTPVGPPHRPSPPTPIVPRVHSLVVHNTEPHVHSFLALIDPTGHYLAVAVNTEMKAAVHGHNPAATVIFIDLESGKHCGVDVSGLADSSTHRRDSNHVTAMSWLPGGAFLAVASGPGNVMILSPSGSVLAVAPSAPLSHALHTEGAARLSGSSPVLPLGPALARHAKGSTSMGVFSLCAHTTGSHILCFDGNTLFQLKLPSLLSLSLPGPPPAVCALGPPLHPSPSLLAWTHTVRASLEAHIGGKAMAHTPPNPLLWGPSSSAAAFPLSSCACSSPPWPHHGALSALRASAGLPDAPDIDHRVIPLVALAASLLRRPLSLPLPLSLCAFGPLSPSPVLPTSPAWLPAPALAAVELISAQCVSPLPLLLSSSSSPSSPSAPLELLAEAMGAILMSTSRAAQHDADDEDSHGITSPPSSAAAGHANQRAANPYRAVEAMLACIRRVRGPSSPLPLSSPSLLLPLLARSLLLECMRSSLSGVACGVQLLSLASAALSLPSSSLFPLWMRVCASLLDRSSPSPSTPTDTALFTCVLARALLTALTATPVGAHAMQIFLTPNIPRLAWGSLSSPSLPISPPPPSLAPLAHWLWLGHSHTSCGRLSSAVRAYTAAGILGTPSLACALLSGCDPGASISLAMRVAEVCFADGVDSLKRGSGRGTLSLSTPAGTSEAILQCARVCAGVVGRFIASFYSSEAGGGRHLWVPSPLDPTATQGHGVTLPHSVVARAAATVRDFTPATAVLLLASAGLFHEASVACTMSNGRRLLSMGAAAAKDGVWVTSGVEVSGGALATFLVEAPILRTASSSTSAQHSSSSSAPVGPPVTPPRQKKTAVTVVMGSKGKATSGRGSPASPKSPKLASPRSPTSPKVSSSSSPAPFPLPSLPPALVPPPAHTRCDPARPILADWRVNASLCGHFLPLLPPSRLSHAVARRARRALVCGDRVALAGSLAIAATRLRPPTFRRLRLRLLRDGVLRMGRLLAVLPPLRRPTVDSLLRPLPPAANSSKKSAENDAAWVPPRDRCLSWVTAFLSSSNCIEGVCAAVDDALSLLLDDAPISSPPPSAVRELAGGKEGPVLRSQHVLPDSTLCAIGSQFPLLGEICRASGPTDPLTQRTVTAMASVCEDAAALYESCGMEPQFASTAGQDVHAELESSTRKLIVETAVLCLDLIGSAVGPSSLADTLVESLSLPSPSSPPPPVPTTAGLSFSTDLLPPSGPASAEAVGVRACARSLLLSLWCVCCRDAASVWAAMCEGGWLADLHGPAVAIPSVSSRLAGAMSMLASPLPAADSPLTVNSSTGSTSFPFDAVSSPPKVPPSDAPFASKLKSLVSHTAARACGRLLSIAPCAQAEGGMKGREAGPLLLLAGAGGGSPGAVVWALSRSIRMSELPDESRAIARRIRGALNALARQEGTPLSLIGPQYRHTQHTGEVTDPLELGPLLPEAKPFTVPTSGGWTELLTVASDTVAAAQDSCAERFTSELASAYAASGDSSIIPKGLTPCAQYPVSALTSALADPAFTSFCNSIARLVAAGVFARPPALPGVGVEEKEPKPLLEFEDFSSTSKTASPVSGAPTQRVVEPAAAVAKDPVPSSKPERSAVKAVPVLKSLDLSFLKRSPTEDRPASENAGPLAQPPTTRSEVVDAAAVNSRNAPALDAMPEFKQQSQQQRNRYAARAGPPPMPKSIQPAAFRMPKSSSTSHAADKGKMKPKRVLAGRAMPSRDALLSPADRTAISAAEAKARQLADLANQKRAEVTSASSRSAATAATAATAAPTSSSRPKPSSGGAPSVIPALAASAASKPKRAHAAPVPVKISLTPRAPEPDGPAGADADVSSSDDSVSSSSSGDDFASALPTALAPMPSDPRSRHSYPIRASDQAMMDPPSGHRRQQRSSTDQVSVQPPGVQQQPAQQQLSRTNQLEEQQRFSASDAEKQVQSDSAAVVETTMGQYAIGPSASDSKYSSVGKANSSVTSPISASDDGDVGRSMPDPISPLDSLGDSPERITVPTLLAVGPRGPIGGGEEPSRRPRHSPSPAPSVGETLLPNPLPMPILLHARPPPPEKTFARAAGVEMMFTPTSKVSRGSAMVPLLAIPPGPPEIHRKPLSPSLTGKAAAPKGLPTAQSLVGSGPVLLSYQQPSRPAAASEWTSGGVYKGVRLLGLVGPSAEQSSTEEVSEPPTKETGVGTDPEPPNGPPPAATVAVQTRAIREPQLVTSAASSSPPPSPRRPPPVTVRIARAPSSRAKEAVQTPKGRVSAIGRSGMPAMRALEEKGSGSRLVSTATLPSDFLEGLSGPPSPPVLKQIPSPVRASPPKKDTPPRSPQSKKPAREEQQTGTLFDVFDDTMEPGTTRVFPVKDDSRTDDMLAKKLQAVKSFRTTTTTHSELVSEVSAGDAPLPLVVTEVDSLREDEYHKLLSRVVQEGYDDSRAAKATNARVKGAKASRNKARIDELRSQLDSMSKQLGDLKSAALSLETDFATSHDLVSQLEAKRPPLAGAPISRPSRTRRA